MRYEIKGDTLPVAICYLESGEKMITEGGAMSWMSPNMTMETSTRGTIGKAFSRMFAGESMFQNIYTAEGGPGMIAISSSFPGDIIPYEIGPGKELIVQRSGFMACEEGVDVSVYLQKKMGTGIFGGEGFVLTKLAGQGTAFLELDGHTMEYQLEAGQQLVVSSGHLAAMEATCSMDIRSIPGMKNKLLGGEGFFNTVITGPGRVWLQTMPLSGLAARLRVYMPSGGSD